MHLMHKALKERHNIAQGANHIIPLVALCAPHLPASGFQYVFRLSMPYPALTHRAIICRPFGAIRNGYCPLNKSFMPPIEPRRLVASYGR